MVTNACWVFFVCRFSNLRPNAKPCLVRREKTANTKKKQVDSEKKWQTSTWLHAQEERRERQSVNDDIWKFMDESIDSGDWKCFLLLAAQIEVIVHIIRWINMVFKYSYTQQYIFIKIYIWIKHKCKLFGVPCHVFVYMYWTLYVRYKFYFCHTFLSFYFSTLLVFFSSNSFWFQSSSIVNNSFAPSIDIWVYVHFRLSQ